MFGGNRLRLVTHGSRIRAPALLYLDRDRPQYLIGLALEQLAEGDEMLGGNVLLPTGILR